MGVLGDDMLLQGVALRKPLVAVRTDEVPPTLVDGLHVLLETGGLHHFAADDAIDVLVCYDHLGVNFIYVSQHACRSRMRKIDSKVISVFLRS